MHRRKERYKVEKKIIELKNENTKSTCLICCERDATIKMIINRPKHNDTVISFHICDRCLAKMQDDIQKTCE